MLRSRPHVGLSSTSTRVSSRSAVQVPDGVEGYFPYTLVASAA